MTEENENLEVAKEYVAELAGLATCAISELEQEIENDGKSLDAEDHPFVTGVEVALARLINSVVTYGRKRGLRLSKARQSIIDAGEE
jgi:hypothetical protein